MGVTNFFRDKDVFLSIEKNVIPQIFKNKSNYDPIRIWIVGCSTGEEAYSIAMLLREFADLHEKKNEITIFATDIDAGAVNKARHGVYPKNIEADISKERLKRHFTKVDDQYIIKKKIRKMLIFAEQNVLEDPPFSRMDMITCRNLLIYLQPESQGDLLRTLVYAVKTNGFLVLGTADSLGEISEIFEDVDGKAKIYKKQKMIVMKDKFKYYFPTRVNLKIENTKIAKREKPKEFEDLVNNMLLETFSPPSLLVNRDKEIIYIHGDLSRYLNLPTGVPKLDFIEMARSDLGLGIATAFRQAILEEKEVTYSKVTNKEKRYQIVLSVTVKPLQERDMGIKLFLVSFKETRIDFADVPRIEMKSTDSNDEKVIKHLENELEITKINLQQTIEEFETSNEELKSSNEELQSANEELKTTNEELQTSKEELQSVNEELRTVNEELSSKNLQLSKLNDDLDNLISSTQIATIFLDTDLNIQKYTPQTTEVLNLIPSDIGRPFTHISPKLMLQIKDLVEDTKQVLNNLIPIEKDVVTEENKWYTMKISPYRTSDNVIEGVVVTFVDITERKFAEEKLKKSEDDANFAYKKSEFYRKLFTHDISNILQVILSTVNIIERYAKKFEEKDELKEFFKTIQEQVIKARNLTTDIQRLTTLDKKIVDIIPIDLIEYLNHSIESLKSSFPNVNYDFEFMHKYKRLKVQKF
ncbi:MAG: CheR family methyltransferase [Candidatus Lokiarchaeota archaeon]